MSQHYYTAIQEQHRSTMTGPAAFPPGYLHRQSFTVWTAPAGSVRADGQVSHTGHVFLSVEHFTSSGYQRSSIGFSPGADWGSSHDNISFGDVQMYPGASSHTFSSNNPNFRASIDSLLRTINGYKNGELTPPEYDLASNNCIDFVQETLKAASVNVELQNTPNGVLENLQSIGDAYITPIAIDLDGGGVSTVSIDNGVTFDFDGDGVSEATGWIAGNDGLLVLDRNGDGLISDGSELFGEHTLLGDGTRSKDGFVALAELDSNADGIISELDDAWSSLAVWRDLNQDGISDEGELISVEQLGIDSISLASVAGSGRDSYGNIHTAEASVSWKNGDSTSAVDILLKQANDMFSAFQGPPVDDSDLVDAVWQFDVHPLHDQAVQLA